MRILFYLVAGYLLLTGFVWLIQRKMLYFPDPAPPISTVHRGNGLHLEPWPGKGADFRGYTGNLLPENSPARGTVVVFHGNAGAASDRIYYPLALETRGYRVVLAEYPGYGGRSGELSEDALIRDGRETARRALAEFGEPLLVWGESLGAAVAAGVAADRTLPVAGVVLITPWDSLVNLAQRRYWYLPVDWLLRDRYESRLYLDAYHGPVAVLAAEQDEIIPSRHSQHLYDALHEPKRHWIFQRAGHNSWPVDPQAAWWDEVLKWFEVEAQPFSRQRTEEATMVREP